MKRRHFLQLSGSLTILLANGNISRANSLAAYEINRAKRLFRFAVASDGHYGQPDTDFAGYFSNLVQAINTDNDKDPFAFTVINGDIVHDDKSHYPAAKLALDKLLCKYYVTQGNHDHVNADEWQNIWNMPVNLDFICKRNAFLAATSSNEKGEYLCPDLEWMSRKLEEHKDRPVYVFIHINPGKLTKHAVDCPELFDLFDRYKNIKAVFNGHDHDEDGIKKRNGIPFVFDAHFGGSWGTEYRGYRVVDVMKDGTIATYIMTPSEERNRDSW